MQEYIFDKMSFNSCNRCVLPSTHILEANQSFKIYPNGDYVCVEVYTGEIVTCDSIARLVCICTNDSNETEIKTYV